MGGSFKELFAEIEKTISYKQEKAKLDFTIEIQDLMKRKGKSRADLARELNKTNAYVTQILRGERNFTIETMVELADALDSEINIHFSPQGEKTVNWYRVIQNVPSQKKTIARTSWPKIQGFSVETFQPTDVADDFNICTSEKEANGYAIAS